MFNHNKKNIKRKLLSTICLGFLIFFVPAASLSANDSTSNYYKNPKTILDEISKRGARTIVSELYDHPTEWNFVLQHIARGTKTWLKVAVALYPGSDAGASEMLELSVGEALEKAPVNVFSVTLPVFQLESICSGPDVDNARYDSYDLAIKAIDRRQKRISAITDPKLKNVSNKCIQLLEESKAEVARFYGIH